MSDTRQEAIIREAIASLAEEAVDHRVVLANLRDARKRRRSIAMFAAVGLTAVAAAVAVIVPLSVDRVAAPPEPAAPPTTQTALLMGLDGEAHTDSVVLLRLNSNGTATALSLPRDSWVDIPGFGKGKLNSAYALAHERARTEGRDADIAGTKALVEAVEALVGVKVDHYAAVDMAAFAPLSDAVGGVEVCLKAAARDQFSGVDLPAGRQTLSGDQALAFLRQRHGLVHGDLDRVVRQQAFLQGLGAKLAEVALTDVAQVTRLVQVARTHVRTDPGWDVLEFAERLRWYPSLTVGTIPVGEQITTDSGMALSVDPERVREFAHPLLAEDPQVVLPSTPGTPVPAERCVD
ncbi:MAG: LCP family protein [Saccharothrix sp.]|nr:LCP family protein [Saccharothrix sp.]